MIAYSESQCISQGYARTSFSSSSPNGTHTATASCPKAKIDTIAPLPQTDMPMHIQLDLNQNDLEALLRHCKAYEPESDDARENQRLSDALQALEEALQEASTSR
ncbi:hypothetical protein [Pseudomonas chlororaphis]|uniref:hypothetical protein n=1 Tax=Pseudomonas chlororaphis TaxID=587753 RepID=UPI0039E0786A